MTAIIAWILANPTVLAIIAGIVGALGFGLQQRRAGAKAERTKQRAKDADSYEQSLKEVAEASSAANAVRADDGLSNSDPNNRDTR